MLLHAQHVMMEFGRGSIRELFVDLCNLNLVRCFLELGFRISRLSCVDDPGVGCNGFNLISEVVVSGVVVSEVIAVSEFAVSQLVFSNSVSCGVLSPKQRNHFL